MHEAHNLPMTFSINQQAYRQSEILWYFNFLLTGHIEVISEPSDAVLNPPIPKSLPIGRKLLNNELYLDVLVDLCMLENIISWFVPLSTSESSFFLV